MKEESSAINTYNGMFGQQGWICPKCGRVYSPFTQMCLYCKPNNTTNISNLCDLSNTTVSEEELIEKRKTIKERNGMQVRTQRNFNKKTGEDLFGLSIKLEVGHRYCKYPIGHQDYKTITEATKAKKKVMEQLRNGAHLDYGINGTAGINKAEYVKIVD